MVSDNMKGTEKTLVDYEEELVRRIEDLSYIITGLENYGPYNKAIDMFKQTRSAIDETWHLVTDPVKFSELRMTKFAANSIIDYVQNLKSDLDKLQVELVKLRAPEEFVNKDYDTE